MEDNIKTSLIRLSFTRVCSVYVESKDKYFQLNNIAFYDEKGIIVEVGQGYFDNDEDFIFNGNVVYKLKENFSNKQNYVMKSKNNSYSWNNNYTLYVYIGNVDFKYEGLIKRYSNIYKKYSVNGIEVKSFVKSLEDNSWRYKDEIEKCAKKIERCVLPLEENEVKDICKRIVKYNKLLLAEQQWIKDYEPNVEDLENNFEKAFKRKE